MAAISNSSASRWRHLISICAALPDVIDLEHLLQWAVRETATFFDVEHCAVFVKRDGGLIPAAWAGFPQRPPSGLAIDSVRGLRDHLDRLLAPGSCRRFMSADIRTKARFVGYLVVCSEAEGLPPFNRDDREMLKLIVHRLAVSVAGIDAMESARGQQEALARIAAALAGEVEVREVAQTAASLAVQELGANGVMVWIAHLEERELELLASKGFDEKVANEVRKLSFDAPTLASLTATTREIQNVGSIKKMPESVAVTKRLFAAAGMQSAFDVPLLARDRLMGVLGYARKTPHRWVPGERLLFRTLADLLAAAILNAELYEESERRRLLAEAVIDNSPVGIAVIAGPEHRYVMVNAARERMTGVPRDRMIGRTVMEAFPTLAGGPVLPVIEQVYRTADNVLVPDLHFDFGPPVGERDLSLLFAPLRGPGGQVEAVISLMLDITEQQASRRQLEDLTSRLKASNEQLVEASFRAKELAVLAERRAVELEATISNIADSVFVCDPEGKITYINSSGLQMIGGQRPAGPLTVVDYIAALKPRTLDGKPISRDDLSISRALRGEVVRGTEEIVYDARLRQDRYILVSSAPMRDPDGRFLGAVQILSDITRLKELDLLKDQFITVAAHEIKTPVTAIKGFAQTLAKAPDACAPRYRRALETMVQQSDRIDALVRDFLDVSRMRWGRVKLVAERMNLTDLVAEAVARRASLSPRHELAITREDPVWIEGDRDRLNQVIENLLDNAVKFSPGGGKIEVQVRREEQRAVVSVRDEGVGIPKDRQAHLFERFYRAHIGTPFDYGGLGVGLYISREIVRQHGGEMWFESEEGKGSTFYFSLPLASTAASG